MKYILVCGGVISGVGKGVISSSIGKILKDRGFRVTVIKVDPYLNFDAGTLGPKDHGEVFVLNDGCETDLDLGNYERFLDINLTHRNSITSGRMYKEVIEKERRGDYLGKTVQVVPHLTDHILNSIESAARTPIADAAKSVAENRAKKAKREGGREPSGPAVSPEICIVELGGTVGDIESSVFIEALRQLKRKVGKTSFFAIGVDHVLSLNGEDKTKPVQASARRARELGIQYDLIVCRSHKEVAPDAIDKIHLFCDVEMVVCVPDCNVLCVPGILMERGLFKCIQSQLDLDHARMSPDGEAPFAHLLISRPTACKIVVVGKYNNHPDAYLSIKESIRFAGALQDVSVDLQFMDSVLFEGEENTEAWVQLSEADGIIIPGGFGKRGAEGMVAICKYAREKKIPYFAICLGHQITVIEFCRNVLKIKEATSEEFACEEDIHTIIGNSEQKVDEQSLQAAKENRFFCIVKSKRPMRMGSNETFLVNGGLAEKLYIKHGHSVKESSAIHERFRHRYVVNMSLRSRLEENGLMVGIVNEADGVIDGIEIADHPHFVSVQYHPEFLSRPHAPHPLFSSLVYASLEFNRNKIK